MKQNTVAARLTDPRMGGGRTALQRVAFVFVVFNFNFICTAGLQFCIMLLLPNKTSAWGPAREVYTALKELALKYKTDPVKLVYVDADKHVSDKNSTNMQSNDEHFSTIIMTNK